MLSSKPSKQILKRKFSRELHLHEKFMTFHLVFWLHNPRKKWEIPLNHETRWSTEASDEWGLCTFISDQSESAGKDR